MKFTLFILIFLNACSTPYVPPQNVGLILDGFTCTTPPGWFIVEASQTTVILNKKTNKEISEVGWSLTGDGPDDLTDNQILDWIKAEKISQASSGRMAAVSDKFSNINLNGLKCLLYQQISRDKPVNKLLSGHGITCLHPTRTGHYVDLNLTQRYGDEITPFNYKPEAELFFRTLKSK